MSEALNRCPFCGGEAFLRSRHDYWRIECVDCPVQIAMDVAGECVEAWNRRVPGPDRGTVDDLGRLDDMARELASARADAARLLAAAKVCLAWAREGVATSRRWTELEGAIAAFEAGEG